MSKFTCCCLYNGDGCVDYFCNATDGTCYYISRAANCDNLTNICNIGYCDPTAPQDAQCFQRSVICPHANNCTLAFCYDNSTSGQMGCYNTTLDCFVSYGALIGGLAAGVVAAIVLAALIACCAIAGGGAYAVAGVRSAEQETEVICNPLFTGAGSECHNPIHHNV